VEIKNKKEEEEEKKNTHLIDELFA